MELKKQLVLWRCRASRADEWRLDAGAGEFLDEQNLMRVSPAQPIGSIDEQGLDPPLRRQITRARQPRTNKARPAMAVVFDHPLRRNVAILLAGEGDERSRLARDRVLLLLFVRRYPGVEKRRFSSLSPVISAPARDARHIGNQHVVNPFELGAEQPVEREFEPNIALPSLLSHVRDRPPEKRLSPCV